MKEFRDKKVILSLLGEIQRKANSVSSSVRVMEVCGTHTMTIHKFGLKKLMKEAGVEMVSGPGCPVCITPNEIHEAAINLVTQKRDVILATFGDMTRVPTNQGSLQTAVPASGSKVQVVYSPKKAVELAQVHPQKDVVFFGAGFETTIPGIALTLKQARAEGLTNYSILTAFWLIPPALKALVEDKYLSINGFIYPGHVSAIIGEKPYHFIAQNYHIPGTIAGFEPSDILLAVSSILDQITEGRPAVANQYTRVVQASGNSRAQQVMDELLIPKDTYWRGLGLIPQSGLKIKKEFSSFDAESKYAFNIQTGSQDLPGCRCGDVLKGKISPSQCPLFSSHCLPRSPHGPCMVSVEGACFAHYKYRTR